MTRARRGEDGQALVEFSLALVPFLLIVFGIIDGGYATYAYVTLGNAVREGTRVAIVSTATDAEVRAAVNAHGGMLHLVDADTTVSPSSRTSGTAVTVTVTYAYQPITPIVGAMIGRIPLRATSKVTVE